MDEVLTIAYRLLRYLPDVCMHFASSALVGLLAWYWTWIISWHLLGIIWSEAGHHSHSMSWSQVCEAGRYISRLSWSVALFCAIALHVSQDFYIWLW